ncbi:MAG: HAD family phosphatase [Deltaproteobacteria bacterium]|nr:HAD family phosphatase [Deltaproteobacteria bacterium]
MPGHALLAVVFDMDGVLLDSQAAHLEAFRQFVREHGATVDETLLRRTFGMHNRDILPMLLGRPLPADERARLADEKEALYRRLARGRLREVPGARALVDALAAAGIPLAVGSSGPRANVELAVEELGMRGRFRALCTGDDIRHGKPDPEVFLLAAQRLGVEPEGCVVVEDAPEGVEAARAAGMRVLAVTTSRAAAQLGRAHRVVDSLVGLGVADLERV